MKKMVNEGSGEHISERKVILAGFALEPTEMAGVNKIVNNYAKKISQAEDFQELRITLKTAEKAKAFLHTIHADLTAGRVIAANSQSQNLYNALSEALNKVYAQVEHTQKQ